MHSSSGSGYSGAGLILFLILFLLAQLVYFVPLLIAHKRRHSKLASIAVINIFLGWTLVGWVVALAWALAEPDQSNDKGEHTERVPCPHCAELIKHDAKVCPFCRRDIPLILEPEHRTERP